LLSSYSANAELIWVWALNVIFKQRLTPYIAWLAW
jgi:hypothetical protein